ncbi:ribose-phosphate diphosphokinase [Neoehrlichia mikurensis]|uniref:ribose-phosphate diphosphokinase n=1 Tax=Neoehrlichia mikurensis TaxID=89586 RepID=A0A9Q9C0V4_9RICK|nr:ribose-phosphate diphosphokinase [Neoehrlichia mikurensis]QXK91656.1 ribose-phosphate diphosphokinase [Neoehrlichia mikurensis]QXK92867.1 ribose-phosphate diphosphokinase [Neoehrlichia mikurensis]QXK93347.1 ribose-phosphate diphosphokinase [Neoehrlichia mikurensis]UTO55710.1 ribose-phosphate diphosphokinase [Neoehrlichia mikurensis]UTO56627.1 ribose-phosphate diphosphokinase [Neoehrlichia mikurensis]
MLIISGTSNIPLATSISNMTGIKLVNTVTSRFSDQELNIEVESDISYQNKHVVIIQSLSYPSGDNLVELLLLTDAVTRALNPKKITAIIPYFCYSRQDRVISRKINNQLMFSPISAKVIAKILKSSNINHIITIDLHSKQLEGFFDIPITNLTCHNIFIDNIIAHSTIDKLVIVSPDCGSLNRVRNFTKILSNTCKTQSIQSAMIDKYRESPGVSEVMYVLGDVKGKHCIIIDDIIDSGGTLCNAAIALKNRGAIQVDSYITHGVLSGQAVDTILNSELDNLIITDTIQNDKICSKIKIKSISNFLSQYIIANLLHNGKIF